jgi:hypothetical protein
MKQAIFFGKMKPFWKYEKYDKQIGIFIYFTRRLYNKKILRKMIITFTFRSLVHDFQFCCGDILMFKLKAWRRGARYIPLIVIVNWILLLLHFEEESKKKEQKLSRLSVFKGIFQMNHDLLKRSDHALEKIEEFRIQFVIEISFILRIASSNYRHFHSETRLNG